MSSIPTLTPDTQEFIATLKAHAQFFSAAQPVYVARAPGRLDLMGGIADYSGALVLELPLACATWAAVQWADEATATVLSLNADDIHGTAQVSVPLTALFQDYGAVHAHLTASTESAWAAYVLGALTVLHLEHGAKFPRGLKILISSQVPAGKGVSSSAAIEVATLHAVCGLLNLELDGRQLAILCQKVENRVVGAPCGIMDQMTSACGRQGQLLALLCQPAELQPPVHLPAELEVWGIDSGIRHIVSGADYGSVRVGAFMGYRIVAELAGLITKTQDKQLTIDDARWGGYLANISPAEWETHFRARVPEQIMGAEFLARYGGYTDTVTRIDPARTYAVRQPAAHPIYEHWRVRQFRALLQSPTQTDEIGQLLGELMYQSHWSYSACGLGSDGTDELVELVRMAGPSAGLFGAKITGGGSGGTVAVLGRRGSENTVRALAEHYRQNTGRLAQVLGGSSPGAVQFGVHQTSLP